MPSSEGHAASSADGCKLLCGVQWLDQSSCRWCCCLAQVSASERCLGRNMHCKSWLPQTSIQYCCCNICQAPRCCCLLLTLGSAAAEHMQLQASAPHPNARLHLCRGPQAEREKGLKGMVC